MSAIKRLETDTTPFTETLDLYDMFKDNAEKIGAEIYRAANPDKAFQIVKQVLSELNVKKVAAAPSPMVLALGLGKLSEPRVVCENLQQEALLAEVGICSAEIAVAETGSLGQVGSSMEERLVSKLSDTNIVLINTDNLVATFQDAMIKIYRESKIMPSYISFISGPSRTSDIERVLTIGVHGPKRLIIVFVDELSGGN